MSSTSGPDRASRFWAYPLAKGEVCDWIMAGMRLTGAWRCDRMQSSIGIGPTIEAPRGLAMAKVARTDAVWVEVDVASLPNTAQAAYADYKRIYKDMKAAREGFEQAMSDAASLPEGKRMVFGYNFGKLSVAIVDDDRKPAKATPAKQSLADFIAAQQAQGRRA